MEIYNNIDKIIRLKPINSFNELYTQKAINPMAFSFIINALPKESPEIDLINLNCKNYIDLMFEYNKINSTDRDRCELARDYYREMFEVDSSKKQYADLHEWSYDTINSFQTTYNQGVKLYCNDLLKKCKSGEIEIKTETSQNQRISRQWLINAHKELLSKSKEYTAYKEMNELEYLQQFAYWVKTLGNFTLIPFYYRRSEGTISSLNGFRGCDGEIKDYFDLSVDSIFDSFFLMSRIKNSQKLPNFKMDYVKKFYMDDYFDFSNGDVPKSIPLFERKKSSPLPQNKEEFKKSILEMIIRIINRGKRITSSNKCNDSFHNFMREEKYQELLGAYKECLKIKLCDTCIYKNNNCIIKKACNSFVCLKS